MAKKRRSRRRRGKKRRAPVVAARPAPPREEKRAEAEPSLEAVALAEQYPYVYDDLKRIAILAGTMFAILIILFFLIK